MPIKEKVQISDQGITTLKKIQEQHKSFREELASTRKELKNTWDKRYKPVIETTGAFKSIQSIQNKAAGMKESLKAKIHIDDSHLQKLNDAKSKMTAFGRIVISPAVRLRDTTKSTIDAIYKKMLRIGKTVISPIVKIKDNATTKIRRIKSEVSYLSKTIAIPAVVLKDNVTSKVKLAGSKLKELAHKTFTATINAADKTAKGIASAASRLGSIAKKTVIPVTVAATVATAGLAASVKSGMDLESQQLSIKHFIGATNKNYGEQQIEKAAQTFTEALRVNANATPFETGEVIAAGTRAVSVTQGNTNKAMDLVKLAEDMAAASGGKNSLEDAVEALAGLKVGETERLKQFGFKINAEELKKKGYDGVTKDLSSFFGGAAGKLATTGSGLVSTITGKLKSSVADFGLKVVDQLKPVLTNIISFVDKAMPVVDKLGTAFGNSLGKGIQAISKVIPSFVSGFKQMMPTFQVIISGIQQMMPPILAFGSTVVGTIQGIVVQATPVIATIISAISRILPAVQPIFSSIIATVGNIVTTILPPLGNAFSMVADVIVGLSPVVQTVFGGISEFIGGTVSGISSVIQGGLDLISSIWSGSWEGVVSSFENIFGGIAEICKAPINGVISILNSCIDAINSVSVDIPDYVPLIGGKHFGFDLGHIPMLAKGGVVSRATTAVVGEAGKEAVMPLERNTGWIGKLASQISSYIGSINTNIPVLQDIKIQNNDSNINTGIINELVKSIETLVTKNNMSSRPDVKDTSLDDIKLDYPAMPELIKFQCPAYEKNTGIINTLISSAHLLVDGIKNISTSLPEKIEENKNTPETGWIDQFAHQIVSYLEGLRVNTNILPRNEEIYDIPLRNTRVPKDSTQNRNVSITLTISKLADQVIVNDQNDIDNLADQVAQKILEVLKNM